MPSRWLGEWKRRIGELGRRLPLLPTIVRLRRRVAARERTAEQRYRILTEAAPVGIFHCGPRGECTYVSERWCTITDLAVGAALGEGWLHAIHPDDRAPVIAEWAAAVRADRPFTAEFRFLRRDGTVVWVLGQALAERNTHGMTMGYIGTITDITARRAADAALRASEEKFAAAFALSPQAITITALPSGHFIEVNEALVRLGGYARDEVIGRTSVELGMWADITVWEQGREAILREGRLSQREMRFRRKDGGIIVGLVAAERIVVGGQPAILTVIADITARREVEERARLLGEVSELLAGTLDEATALAALARLLVRDEADWCLISTLEGDGRVHRRAFAHADPALEAILRELPGAYPYAPARPSGVASVIASGRSRLSPTLTPAELAGGASAVNVATLEALGVASGMIVPLRARGDTFGAISLLRANPARPYGAADLGLAEQIADRAAATLDSARLYAAERAARAAAERAARQQAALAEASRLFAEAGPALEPLLDATARHLTDLIGDGCTIGLVGDDGERIDVVVSYHRDATIAAISRAAFASAPMRVGVGIIGGVARTGKAALHPVVDEAALIAGAEPALRPLLARYAPRSMIVAPCRSGGRTIGVIAVVRHTPDAPYTPDDLALLGDLADRAALALERARLYDAERAARARLALLADAGILLAGSLDEDQTLATLAKLIVPTFADWCTINLFGSVDLADDDGFRPPIARHVDPARQGALDELLRRYPADPRGEGPLAQVVRTGESLLLLAPPDDGLIRANAPDDDYLVLLAQVGLAATIIVPLLAHDRLLGALRFARLDTSPRYDADDLRVAEVLARRAALALDNARLYRETRAAVAARDRFLSIAAHELRTPVTSMRAYAQLARRQRDRGALTAALAESTLAAIERGTARLNTLVDDLLDVARLQAGQLRIERAPLELVGLLDRVVGEARSQLPAELRLTLAVAVPDYQICGDAGRLEQVLGNLLENARKYSPDGGTIAVALRGDERGATIAVRDEGLGLGVGEAQAIFIPFNRTEEALRRQIQGLGLGLAICRAIVEEHGGTLEATSAGYGHGTTFTLWLPAPPDAVDMPTGVAGSTV